MLIFLYRIKMTGKILKFDNIEIKSHKSKQTIDLNLVDLSKIAILDKFKRTDDGFIILLVTKKMISLILCLLFCLK